MSSPFCPSLSRWASHNASIPPRVEKTFSYVCPAVLCSWYGDVPVSLSDALSSSYINTSFWAWLTIYYVNWKAVSKGKGIQTFESKRNLHFFSSHGGLLEEFRKFVFAFIFSIAQSQVFVFLYSILDYDQWMCNWWVLLIFKFKVRTLINEKLTWFNNTDQVLQLFLVSEHLQNVFKFSTHWILPPRGEVQLELTVMSTFSPALQTDADLLPVVIVLNVHHSTVSNFTEGFV